MSLQGPPHLRVLGRKKLISSIFLEQNKIYLLHEEFFFSFRILVVDVFLIRFCNFKVVEIALKQRVKLPSVLATGQSKKVGRISAAVERMCCQKYSCFKFYFVAAFCIQFSRYF